MSAVVFLQSFYFRVTGVSNAVVLLKRVMQSSFERGTGQMGCSRLLSAVVFFTPPAK